MAAAKKVAEVTEVTGVSGAAEVAEQARAQEQQAQAQMQDTAKMPSPEEIAEKNAYYEARLQAEARDTAYRNLPAKYGMTYLGLSVEYVRFTMHGTCGIPDSADLSLIEAKQDGLHLLAASSLIASGKY